MEENRRDQEKDKWNCQFKEKEWRKNTQSNPLFLICIENYRHPILERINQSEFLIELYDIQIEAGGEEKDPGSHISFKEGRGEASKNDKVIEWVKEEIYQF